MVCAICLFSWIYLRWLNGEENVCNFLTFLAYLCAQASDINYMYDINIDLLPNKIWSVLLNRMPFVAAAKREKSIKLFKLAINVHMWEIGQSNFSFILHVGNLLRQQKSIETTFCLKFCQNQVDGTIKLVNPILIMHLIRHSNAIALYSSWISLHAMLRQNMWLDFHS